MVSPIAGTQSPRPISKVRTNFIAVEKDGRIGLQNPSRESSVAGSTRKPSGDPETPSLSRSTSYDRPAASPDDKKGVTPSKTSLKEQPIPECPGVKSPSKMTTDLLPGQAANSQQEAPPINPDNNIDVEEPNTRMVVGGPTDVSAVTGNGSILPSGGFGEGLNGTGGGKEKKSTEAVKPNPPSKATPSKSAAPKPVTASKTTSKSTTTTPSKPLKSPTTAAAPKPTNKASEKPGIHVAHTTRTSAPQESTSTIKPATSSTVTSAKPAAKRPPPLEASPKSTGFVKPKPKSPTRPVKLPPSLTTHTAASATKFNVRRESHGSSEGRSNSRASLSGATSKTAPTTTTEKGLTRKTSTISRAGRPSIGPPPKQPPKDQPTAKKESKVDEGFLARMMRPTQASAQKTAEKAPTTPPKKTSAAPTTKKTSAPVEKRTTAPAATKPSAAVANKKHTAHVTKKADAPVAKKVAATVESKVVEPVKKAVAQTAQAVSNATTSAAKPEHKEAAVHDKRVNKTGVADKSSGEKAAAHTQPKDSKPSTTAAESPAKVVAPVVEQAATAEEIVAAASKTEGHVPLPKDVDLPSPKEASTIGDIAPVVEQLDSADLAIEAAKVADGDYTIPDHPLKPVVKGTPTTVKDVAPVVEQLESAEEAIQAAKAVDMSANLSIEPEAGKAPKETETSPVDFPAPQEASSIKDIAPVVEQLDSAEEAIEAAKVADGDYSLPEQPVKPVITGAPSLKEVAPVVEQIDSAEEAIKIAKEADGETSLPTELSAPGDIINQDARKQNGAPSEVPLAEGGHEEVGKPAQSALADIESAMNSEIGV